MRSKPQSLLDPEPIMELQSGDRMTQAEFHRIYEVMPDHFKAELIGGTVYVASPLKRTHGKHHLALGALFAAYEGNTPGVDAADNATVILSEDDEPQPDLFLRVLPVHSGQTIDTADGYVEGAPELMAEIANSSRSIDLHDKREQYAAAKVLEYIVVCVRPQQMWWFDLKNDQELLADSAGIFRSIIFPGLWIDGAAVLQLNYHRFMSTLQQGLASPEHAAFVARLAAAKK